MTEEITPKDEPEVRRAKGRHYADWCNKHVKKPYKNVYIALELAAEAYEQHELEYESGLSGIIICPPERFVWSYDEATGVNIRDTRTGREVICKSWE